MTWCTVLESTPKRVAPLRSFFVRDSTLDLGELERQASMIHYVYATRGGYLYQMGRYTNKPAVENSGEFVLSVPEKTSQSQIDTLAHRQFMDHLRRPRKAAHERHAKTERELATV